MFELKSELVADLKIKVGEKTHGELVDLVVAVVTTLAIHSSENDEGDAAFMLWHNGAPTRECPDRLVTAVRMIDKACGEDITETCKLCE